MGAGDPRHRQRSRRVTAGLVALALLCGGVLLGRAVRPGAHRTAASDTVTITAATLATRPHGAATVATNRTEDGAAAAAGRYVAWLGGDAILDPARIRQAIAHVAARAAQRSLEEAYASVSAQVQRQFGIGGQPKPIVILRSAPVAFRVEHFSPTHAVVAVWNVGIVGSGAGIDPQASWRTQTVSLVWERGDWRVAAFHSESGPTPALAAGDAATTPAELFSVVPTLREYADVRP
jgi:hypothetical protein